MILFPIKHKQEAIKIQNLFKSLDISDHIINLFWEIDPEELEVYEDTEQFLQDRYFGEHRDEILIYGFREGENKWFVQFNSLNKLIHLNPKLSKNQNNRLLDRYNIKANQIYFGSDGRSTSNEANLEMQNIQRFVGLQYNLFYPNQIPKWKKKRFNLGLNCDGMVNYFQKHFKTSLHEKTTEMYFRKEQFCFGTKKKLNGIPTPYITQLRIANRSSSLSDLNNNLKVLLKTIGIKNLDKIYFSSDVNQLICLEQNKERGFVCLLEQKRNYQFTLTYSIEGLDRNYFVSQGM